MINVSVEKHGTENAMSLIRRFQKRVQGAGIVRRVKGARYTERPKSKLRRKKSAIRKIARRDDYAEKERLGLIKETPRAPRRA
ncbi:30S ribosomal protein S21 [Patescibacteria group bacterium]|nr:30S ribosomal protein S21 [Patescibacteria group bacterium]